MGRRRASAALNARPRAEEGASPVALPPLRLSEAAAVPLYEQVKRQISEMILVGTWPPGSVLPSETALAASLGVAVGTVRRALANLATEGLLARRRKTGTVVTGRTPQHNLHMCFQYFRLHGPGDSLIRSQAAAHAYRRRRITAEERAALRLDAAVEVHEFERVRHVDGVAVMRDRIVIPVALAPGIAGMADIPELFYLHLLKQYGVRISAVREKISAELANDDDRKWLARDGAFAVLVIDEIAFDAKGAPVLIAHHRAVTDQCKYINEVS
ncbi:MAG TPA: GntR family transcriptional regulator [Alphaproteobacteria bacterium]|nr:GntR family transcriptional regulator [Alphaproteobacteria bacterium]